MEMSIGVSFGFSEVACDRIETLLAMSISALIIDDEQLARDELKYLLDEVGGVDVLAEGANGIEAVDLIEEHHPDLVFLDVQMPGQDGFAVIQRVMERNRAKMAKAAAGAGPARAAAGMDADEAHLPQFVFATAYDQYAVRAFEVNAVDYLLKPFERARVRAAVERVTARIAADNSTSGASATNSGASTSGPSAAGSAGSGTDAAAPKEAQLDALLRLLNNPAAWPQNGERAAAPAKLIVQAQSRLLLVDQAEICYAAIDEGVIRIVTRTFEGQSKCRTLEDLLEMLDPARFWRAHRGFVVNIDQIREVMPWFKSSYQLRMNDKKQTEIPVSRAQTKRLRELFKL
jgi:two-component system, LytTR family, response regulator LytT